MDRAGQLLLVLCSELARLMSAASRKQAGGTASPGLTFYLHPIVTCYLFFYSVYWHFMRGDANVQGYHTREESSGVRLQLRASINKFEVKRSRYKVSQDSV